MYRVILIIFQNVFVCSLLFGNFSIDSIPTIKFPNVDYIKSCKVIDSINSDSSAKPYITGRNLKCDIDLLSFINPVQKSSEETSYRLSLESTFAQELIILFDTIHIPAGCRLLLYNKEYELRFVLDEGTNNNCRTLTVGPLFGDKIILEYIETKEKTKVDKSIIHISNIGHIFNCSENKRGFGDSDPCNININCSGWEDWCDERRSVSRIQIIEPGGDWVSSCTGSLVVNERRDSRPYFITAGHCVDRDGNSSFSQEEMDNVQYWLFNFNYQSENCENPSSDPYSSGWLYNVSGANWVSGNMNMDFALLELFDRPDGTFNAYYNGWNNESNLWDDGTLIHHPRADIKKITDWEKKTQLFPNFFRMYKIVEGGIEGGTSGAPVFNNSYKMVGIHSASASSADACDTDKARYFGRFCKAWDEGSEPFLRLKDWLNPNATNIYFSELSGDDPCKVSYYFEDASDLHTSENVSMHDLSTLGTRMYDGEYLASDNISTGQNVTILQNTHVIFNAGNYIDIGPGFDAEYESDFEAFIEGCLGGCNNGFRERNSHINFTIDTVLKEKKTEAFSSLTDNQEEVSDIMIYPNPASSFIFIKSKSYLHLQSVYLLNNLGLCKDITISKYQSGYSIDVSNFEKGFYHLILNSDSKTVRFKILII